jgi:hypothetical protein
MGQTVRDIVTHVVREEAPEELPLLAGLKSIDDAGVDRVLARRARAREPLAFGLETVVVLITPVVWGVLSDVAQDGLRAAAENTAGRVKRRLRRWRKHNTTGGEPLALPSLNHDEVGQVRRLVLARCADAGIDELRAAAIADGVAARLLLGLTDEDAEESEGTPPA